MSYLDPTFNGRESHESEKPLDLRRLFFRYASETLDAFFREHHIADGLASVLTQTLDEVQGYLRALVRDRHLAEDLTQETFVKATIAIRKQGCVPAVTKAWLFRIATNLVRDHVRKVKRRKECSLTKVDETAFAQDGPSVDSRLDLRDALEKVRSRFGRHSAEIAGFVRDGWTNHEIAARKNISVRTVERHVAAVRKFLKKRE